MTTHEPDGSIQLELARLKAQNIEDLCCVLQRRPDLRHHNPLLDLRSLNYRKWLKTYG